jgi:hypothetical protein
MFTVKSGLCLHTNAVVATSPMCENNTGLASVHDHTMTRTMARSCKVALAIAFTGCAAPLPPPPTPGVAPAPVTSSPVAVAPPPLEVVPDAAAEAPAPTAAVDTSQAGCAEAHRLVPVSVKTDLTTDAASLHQPLHGIEVDLSMRSDNLSEHAGSGNDSPVQVSDGTRTYGLEGQSDGDLVARDGTLILWKEAGFPIAGGFFGVSLSSGGHIVMRSYSRGHAELFDARTGGRYGEVGRDVVIDPQDRYALDPPEMNWFAQAGHFNRVEVHKLSFTHAPATVRTVARMPTQPTKDWSTVDPSRTPSFGAAICATGDLYVLSHPDGEIALYRAKDDVKLASLPHPPSGRPFFVRSGGIVGIHAPAASNSGEIVAAYRLVP